MRLSFLVVPIAAVLVFGALLRLHRVEEPFVDRDSWRQSSTAMMAENIFHRWNPFYPEINWDGPGPSYNAREFQTVTSVAAVLYLFFGQEDWVGRFVGVMFGIWGIVALHKLIAVVWDRQRALAGAAILAVFPGSIFVDSQFLPDPGMVALITTACWLLLAHLRTGRPVLLWLTVPTGALAFLTKLNGLCVALPMLYAVWSVWSSQPREVVKPRQLGVAGVVTLIPVALYYAWASHLSRKYPPHHTAGMQDFLWNNSFAAWWHDGYYVSALYRELTDGWTPFGFFLVVIGLLLRPPAVPVSTDTMGVRRFFQWWLLLAGGSYFLVGAEHLAKQPYNLHLFDPPAAALAGHTIVTLSAAVRRYVGGFAASAVLLAGVVTVAMVGVQSGYGSEPVSLSGYRMGMALRRITAPEDLVVTLPDFAGDPVAIYYARRHGWVFPPASAWSEITEDWDEAVLTGSAVRWLDGLRTKGARWIGIVRSQQSRIWQFNPKLANYIDGRFELFETNDDYVLYRAR